MNEILIRPRLTATLLFFLVAALGTARATGQTHHENLDHHVPTDPVDHPVTHHLHSGDPTADHHFPHHDPTDPHHHVGTIDHDPDPHHDHTFQHHHDAGTMHHEDHHHSDGTHHHHVGHHGDANSDGHVDLMDLTVFMGGLGGTGDWSHGDFNGDGVVGRTDFALFAQGYGSSYEMAPPSPSPTTAAVPEPASWLLAVAGLSAMTYGVWRKRRAST